MNNPKISTKTRDILSSAKPEKMNKPMDFGRQCEAGSGEEVGGARLVDLCAADRSRVAALVDELSRHAERASAADARIAQLQAQLDSQRQASARDADGLRGQLDSAALESTRLRAQLAERAEEGAKLRTQLEAESRSSAEKSTQAKHAELKYSELRRNAAKVAELNRALESRLEQALKEGAEAETRNLQLQQRLAEREASVAQRREAATQTQPLNQQLVAVGGRVAAGAGTRENAVLNELFFTSPSTPPELNDLFFLSDGHAEDAGFDAA